MEVHFARQLFLFDRKWLRQLLKSISCFLSNKKGSHDLEPILHGIINLKFGLLTQTNQEESVANYQIFVSLILNFNLGRNHFGSSSSFLHNPLLFQSLTFCRSLFNLVIVIYLCGYRFGDGIDWIFSHNACSKFSCALFIC